MSGIELALLACAVVGVMGVLVSWFTTTTGDKLFVLYVLLIVAAIAGWVVIA